MLKEFREFINRGNVIDLAVAVILGTAFNAIVSSLVDDLIMPLVGILLGGIDFSGLAFQVGNATLTYGNLIQAVINFLIIALVLFFIIRGYNHLAELKEQVAKQEAEQEAEQPATKSCPYCATDIPLLAKRCPHCTSQLEIAAI